MTFDLCLSELSRVKSSRRGSQTERLTSVKTLASSERNKILSLSEVQVARAERLRKKLEESQCLVKLAGRFQLVFYLNQQDATDSH